MSKVEKEISSITPVIKATKAFSNIKVKDEDISNIKGAKFSKNTKYAKFIYGYFDFEGHEYSFMDCTSDVMGLHQISTVFNFKLNRGYEKFKLFKAVDKLNETRIGIKASIDLIESSSARIKFSLEMISVGEEITKDKIVVSMNILSSSPDAFWEIISDIRES
ncbi:hypothetical protein [Dickeya undicola]|uniref:hypothetical protein n=1 Tax=Dickeya undicola TaxID=1577887 RepID=UPI000532EC7F|nr:hypothetical protein [Dickeya undicola]